MENKTRRSFFGKMAAMAAVVINSPKLFAQQAPSVGSSVPATAPGSDGPRRSGAGNHTHNGIYYFSGTGSNDNLQVFLCLPLADGIPMPTGKARFDAHKAQYDALNKIYGTYFSPGKAPSRACMALEWIPGDSLIEVVGSAMVVTSPASSTPPAGE